MVGWWWCEGHVDGHDVLAGAGGVVVWSGGVRLIGCLGCVVDGCGAGDGGVMCMVVSGVVWCRGRGR